MDSTQSAALASHPYTCNSCQVAFRSSEAQRNHMKSDWHRYNLKRRVASLPPLDSEVFNEKVLNAQATTKAAADRASFERTCVACQKTYFSENAYQNHIGSQKHKIKQAALQGRSKDDIDSMADSMVSSAFSLGEPINVTRPAGDTEADEDFENVVHSMRDTSLQDQESTSRRPARPSQTSSQVQTPSTVPASDQEMDGTVNTTVENPTPERCLFCNYKSPTFKLNMSHMAKIHALFIPEQKYLTDIEGLFQYLQTKIYENYECLFCHKLKGSAAAVQRHMCDKGHCMVAFESEEELIEIGQFYDFSSTYSDDEDTASVDTATEGGARVSRGDGEEDGWETDSSASSLDSEELSAVPIDDRTHQYSKLSQHRHHTHSDPRPHKNIDGFHSHAHSHSNAAFYSDFELHLPSGRTAGHRALSRYYRQNLHSYPTAEERQAQRLLKDSGDEDGDAAMEDAPPTQRARDRRTQIDETTGAVISKSSAGLIGVTTEQKRAILAAEKRDRRSQNNFRNRQQAKLEKAANNQKHYRDPILGKLAG